VPVISIVFWVCPSPAQSLFVMFRIGNVSRFQALADWIYTKLVISTPSKCHIKGKPSPRWYVYNCPGVICQVFAGGGDVPVPSIVGRETHLRPPICRYAGIPRIRHRAMRRLAWSCAVPSLGNSLIWVIWNIMADG